MTKISPFHEGEIEVQRLTGEQEAATQSSSLIQKIVLPRALDFIRQQSVLWVGIEDQKKFLWAFPLFGSPGFINPSGGKTLEIDLNQKPSIPEEWLKTFENGKSIGCLIIELSSRLRVRINGIIKEISEEQLQIEVQQSYFNCPKYIRKRKMLGNPGQYKFQYKTCGVTINSQLENIISQSDTAFVASVGPNGADVSHRGGSTGFIKFDSYNKIIVPDYKGNSMFNTLGNFKSNPFGGLIIVDFIQGYFLQVTGGINIILDKKHPKLKTGGTNRFWELMVSEWKLFQLENNIKWESLDYSRYNP